MTTPEVCQLLGCTLAALNAWLSRHERYKPAKRNKNGFLWTNEEIERLKEARAISTANNRYKGRPK